ncbi:hypothetical protein SEA_DUMPTRUCK_77 [Gordonia phage DumpTruck]|nr:hypothetical protein SEA_DUMPTRUCK_77 [Gordonia phage DumpTruck]
MMVTMQFVTACVASIIVLLFVMCLIAEVAVKTDKNVNPRLRKKMEAAQNKLRKTKEEEARAAEWLRDHWAELEYEWVPTPDQEWKDREDADVI